MSTIIERTEKYQHQKQEYDIFDCSVFWDPRLTDAFVTYPDWKSQAAAMRIYGIKGGLVTSECAMKTDPFEGNEQLGEIHIADPDFFLCLVLVPEMFFNPEKGRAYLQRMIGLGAVAARLVPGTYFHSTQEYCIGAMLSLLEEFKLPLVVWHIDTGFDAIDRICTSHPKLNVILDSMDRKLLYHARDYYSLLLRHRNFYIETHNLVLFNEYEEIYRIVGDRQMLFGSYSPYACPDFSIYPIIEADISIRSRKRILAGNARELFRLN